MKKNTILGLAILLFTGLLIIACENDNVGDKAVLPVSKPNSELVEPEEIIKTDEPDNLEEPDDVTEIESQQQFKLTYEEVEATLNLHLSTFDKHNAHFSKLVIADSKAFHYTYERGFLSSKGVQQASEITVYYFLLKYQKDEDNPDFSKPGYEYRLGGYGLAYLVADTRLSTLGSLSDFVHGLTNVDDIIPAPSSYFQFRIDGYNYIQGYPVNPENMRLMDIGVCPICNQMLGNYCRKCDKIEEDFCPPPYNLPYKAGEPTMR